jgi:hypothetical protein
MEHKLTIKLLVCVCLVNIIAWSQTETRGTVVVVFGFEQGPVAVAADSREYRLSGNTDDKTCKINILGNKLIIAASGYSGNGKSFSVLANAREVFAALPPGQLGRKDLSSKFIVAWKDSLLDHINRELEAGTINTASMEDSHLTAGLVVGLDEKNLITAWVIHVEVKKDGSRAVAFVPPLEMSNHLPLFNALGKYTIAGETYYGTTARGREWNRGFWQGSDRLPIDDQSTYWARHLVDVTIDNLPLENIGGHMIKTVGGPIDSVTIDHAGRIKWGRHKPDCH